MSTFAASNSFSGTVDRQNRLLSPHIITTNVLKFLSSPKTSFSTRKLTSYREWETGQIWRVLSYDHKFCLHSWIIALICANGERKCFANNYCAVAKHWLCYYKTGTVCNVWRTFITAIIYYTIVKVRFLFNQKPKEKISCRCFDSVILRKTVLDYKLERFIVSEGFMHMLRERIF